MEFLRVVLVFLFFSLFFLGGGGFGLNFAWLFRCFGVLLKSSQVLIGYSCAPLKVRANSVGLQQDNTIFAVGFIEIHCDSL